MAQRPSAASPRDLGGPGVSFQAEYATFFAPRTHKFETVDFRIPSSKVNLDNYFPESEGERAAASQAVAFLGVLVGIVIGIIGFGVDQLTRGITLAIYLPTQVLLSYRTRISFFAGVIAFTVLCNVFVLAATMLVVFIAPLGAGSGIPELKAYLNGVHIPGFLRLRTLVVKTLGVACGIAGGLICGKQGPMIHTGAIVGAGMSQGASAHFGFRLSRPFQRTLRFLRTDAWKRDFTAVGAAIGVAVAFGAPMGGWVWVYEEACTHWTWALGLITLGGCLSGVITIGILNYLASGLPDGGFARFTLPSFGKLYTSGSVKMLFPITDIPMYIIIGIFGGLIGALLPLLNKQITLLRYNRISRRGSRIVEALVIGILTAVIRIAIPKIADDCRPIPPVFVNSVRSSSDFSQFNCPDGQHSIWAAAFYNPTSTVVNSLLFAEDSLLFPALPLFVAFVYYYFFVVWTYGVAVPAGVFFPGFLLGTVYGRLCGVIMQLMFPAKSDVSVGGYAFLGAVSALAGVTRTVSVAIIALEATAKGEAFFGAVVVAIIAKFLSGKLYNLGIYDLHVRLKEMPYLEADTPNLTLYNKVRVRDLMEINVVGVRCHSRVCEVLHVLRTTRHHSFPVFLKIKNQQRKGYVLHKPNESAGSFAMSGGKSAEIAELVLDRVIVDGPAGTSAEMTLMSPQRPPSSIITPTPEGMEATRFEAGHVRVVKLSNFGEVRSVRASGSMQGGVPEGLSSSEHSTFSETASAGQQANARMSTEWDEGEIPDFGLVGMISRDVLLAVLEKLLDIKDLDPEIVAEEGQIVHREKLDSAWPNTLRSKKEHELLDRIEETPLRDFVVDLNPYIDPDPLLMSGRALSGAAYQLLRGTGARHLLVTNMRTGRVVGIVTRKDVLPERISEFLEKQAVEKDS